MKLDLGLEQRHGSGGGDVPGFVEVGAGGIGLARQEAEPGTGEETPWHGV